MRSRRTLAATIVAVALFATACGDDADDATADTSAPTEETVAESTDTDAAAPATADIVDTAVAAGSFTTLVAAVEAAGLVETLKGDGPFTVFAPTDEAFAALPAGLVDKLLLPENKAALTSILTYHVVPAKVMAADVAPGNVATVEGSEFEITVEGSTVMINDATVVTTDVAASNGVIHVIDTVLVPPTVDVASL